MEYPVLKTVHILSAFLLFGTGLGSAFYKFFTDRSGNLQSIATTNRLVVIADWLFTSPTVILQPLTGFRMAHLAGWPLDTPWLVVSFVLFLIAGACWLPVVFMQIRMRDLALTALARGEALPPRYWQLARYWLWLGIPAFLAMLTTVALMVLKP